jgi:hypothetical protein
LSAVSSASSNLTLRRRSKFALAHRRSRSVAVPVPTTHDARRPTRRVRASAHARATSARARRSSMQERSCPKPGPARPVSGGRASRPVYTRPGAVAGTSHLPVPSRPTPPELLRASRGSPLLLHLQSTPWVARPAHVGHRCAAVDLRTTDVATSRNLALLRLSVATGRGWGQRTGASGNIQAP